MGCVFEAIPLPLVLFYFIFTFAQAGVSQNDVQNAVAEVQHLRSQNALLEETLTEVFIDQKVRSYE